MPRADLDALSAQLRDTEQLDLDVISFWLEEALHDSVWRGSQLPDYLVEHALRDVADARDVWREVLETAMRHPPHMWRILCSPLARSLPVGPNSLLEGLRTALLRPDGVSPADWHARLRSNHDDPARLALKLRCRPLSDAGIRMIKAELTRKLDSKVAAEASECLEREMTRMRADGQRALTDLRELQWHLLESGYNIPSGRDDSTVQKTYGDMIPALAERGAPRKASELCSLLRRVGRQADVDPHNGDAKPGTGHDTLWKGLVQAMLTGVTPVLTGISVHGAISGLSQLSWLVPTFASSPGAGDLGRWPLAVKANLALAPRAPNWSVGLNRSLEALPGSPVPFEIGAATNGTVATGAHGRLPSAKEEPLSASNHSALASGGQVNGMLPGPMESVSWLRTAADGISLPVDWLPIPERSNASGTAFAQMSLAFKQVSLLEHQLSSATNSLTDAGLKELFASDIDERMAAKFPGQYNRTIGVAGYKVVSHVRRPGSVHGIGGPRPVHQRVEPGPASRRETSLWEAFRRNHDGSSPVTEFAGDEDVFRYEPYLMGPDGPTGIAIADVLAEVIRYDLGAKVQQHVADVLRGQEDPLASHGKSAFQFNVAFATLAGNITASAGEALSAWAANDSRALRIEGSDYRFRTLAFDGIPVADAAIIEPADLADSNRIESVFLYIPGRMDAAGDGAFNVVPGVLRQYESSAELVQALVEMAKGASPWHSTLAAAAPLHDVAKFADAVATFASARHPDAHISGDLLGGEVWKSRARKFAEHVEACAKKAYVSNKSMEERQFIRAASDELDTLASVMSMVPVIGTVFDIATVVNDATRAFYESHYGDAEEGQQFHRSMLMNSFGAALSVAQDAPFNPVAAKLSLVRLGKDSVMTARPMAALSPDLKRAHRLKNARMDPVTGLRQYQERTYMTVTGEGGHEAYVRVEFDNALGSYRVREAGGALKEPVRFDQPSGRWNLDLNPWLNRASDVEVLGWMLTKPDHFQPDGAEVQLMCDQLNALGVSGCDLAAMARGGLPAERMLPAVAAVVADALPAYLDARLRRAGAQAIASPVLRDVVHAELAKDLGESIIVLKPALCDGATSTQRFISGYGPDGVALDASAFDRLVRSGGARVEVQEISPGVFLPEGAAASNVPGADADLIHAALFAKRASSTGAAKGVTVSSDEWRAQVSGQAGDCGQRMADALRRQPQQAMVDRVIGTLMPGDVSREPFVASVMRLLGYRRALGDAHAPLTREMEARIIKSVLKHDGKGIAVEVEHVPASRAALASQNSPGSVDLSRFGPRKAEHTLHLRAICDGQGRAVGYEYFNEASDSFEPARPWPGSPLLDVLMGSNDQILAKRMQLDRYAMDRLARTLQQGELDAARFAELPSFKPHAIADIGLRKRLADCFRSDPAARSCLLDGRAYIRAASPNGKTHYFEIRPSQSDGVHQILKQTQTSVGRDTGLFVSHTPDAGWQAKWLNGGAPQLRSPADVGEMVRKLDGNVLGWVGQVRGEKVSLVFDLESCSWIKVEDEQTLRHYRQTVIDKSRLPAEQRGLTAAEVRLQQEASVVQTYMLDELQGDVFVEGERFANRKSSDAFRSRAAELQSDAMAAFDIDPVLAQPATFRDAAAAVPIPGRVFQIWVGDADIPDDYLPRMTSVGRGVAHALGDQPVRHEVYLSSPSRAVFDRNRQKLRDALPDAEIIDLDAAPVMTSFRQQSNGNYARMFDWAMEKKAWSTAADVLRFGLLADHVDEAGKCIRPGGGLYVDMDDAFHRSPTRDELSIAPSRALLGPATNNPDLDMRAIINTDCIGVHAGNPLPKEVLDESWRRFERDSSFRSRPKPRPGTEEAEQYASERADILAGPRVLHHVLQQEPYLDPVAARRIQVSRMSTKEGVLPTTAMIKHAQDAAGLEFLEMGSENSWMHHR